MTRDELDDIVDDVAYGDHVFNVGRMGDGFYVQISYFETDVETDEVKIQRGRKWYVSRYSTRSEVVQTLLKAAITSAEHRVREHFYYKGARIFGPHFSVDDLVELTLRGSRDVRVDARVEVGIGLKK